MGKADRLPERLSAEDEAYFKELVKTGYRVSSSKDVGHNCIAYAAGDTTRKWDPGMIPIPGYYWPPNARRDPHPDALKNVFEGIGYKVCTTGDQEIGFEKVALYVDNNGSWSHAAKQEANGEWSCKLGNEEDVRHKSPHCFGDFYGQVSYFMKRRIEVFGNEVPEDQETS
jgi:hypothetical protein